MSDREVVVVGAGVAGLVAARDLIAAGFRVRVLEAGAAIAGRAAQVERGGFRFDRGAEFFTSFYPRVRALIEEVGLEREIVEVRGPGALFREGKLHPLVTGPVSALTTPLLSWRTKFRLRKLAWALVGGLDFSDPRSLVAVDDESAESYGRRTFGDEFTEVCMRPGLESLTLCPIGGTSKAIFLAQAQEGPTARFYSLTGGMGRLVEAMAAGVEVRTECPVRSIREAEGAVEVETGSDRWRASAAVLAVPAPEARSLLGPALPPGLAAFLETVEYTPAVKLNVGLERPLGLPYPGVIPLGDSFAGVAGLQFLAHKGTGQTPEGADGLGVVASGERARVLLEADDERVERDLLAVADRILPERPPVVCRQVVRIPHAVPRFPPGRFRFLAGFDPVAGSRIALAGDYLVSPSMEGAVRSGRRAATRVVEFLAGR